MTVSTAYLSGEHEPVDQELSMDELPVTGALPEALYGLYARNSANPHFHPPGRYHWFDGDGMVHGLKLHAGRASYVNRWIRTQAFEVEADAGHALWRGILEPATPEALRLPGGPLKDTANTDLVVHRGRLLALWWLSGTPVALSTNDLSTLGPETFGGKLTGGFSAHPKVDPRTNELVFFDHSLVREPHLRYGLVNGAGELVRYEAIEVPTPHLLHDMAITEHYSVLLDFPLGWDRQKLKEGKRRIGFDRDTPARFGVLPRHGHAGDVKWFEAKSCYAYHVVNSYEDGDDVVLLACRVADPIPEKRSDSPRIARLDSIELVPHLYEWRLHLKTGAVSERPLDDVATEFPRINDARQGVKARYAYHPRLAPRPEVMFDGFLKYDLLTGAEQVWNAPPNWYVGEAAFAPAPDPKGEDDGWLVTFGTNAVERKSAAFVFDARDLRDGPIATVALPQRIPLGFHSAWCPGA